MRKRFMCALATIALLQTAGAPAQQAEELFQQARTKEIVSGDREGALRIYADIAGRSGTSAQLAALSLWESARLYEALGRKEQAIKALNQIVAQHQGQKEIVAKAWQRLAALAPASDPVRIELPFTMDAFSFALSPDGSKLVYSVSLADRGELRLRDLRTGKSAPIPGATIERGAFLSAQPFWSPDGRSIAYFSGGKLMRIGVAGGKARTLADAPGRGGGSWAGDFILYNGNSDFDRPGRFRLLRANGEAPSSVLDFGGYQPSFLPDGKHFLFFRSGGGLEWLYSQAVASLWIGSTDGSMQKNLPVRASAGAFVAPDTLLYVVQQSVFAQRMDMNSFELLGEPRRIADSVLTGGALWGLRAIAVSQSGSMAFTSGGPRIQRQLVWLDRDGKQVGAARAPDTANPSDARISPDGRQVLITRKDGSSPIPSSVVWEEGLPESPPIQGGVSGIWSPGGDVVLSFGPPAADRRILVHYSRAGENWLGMPLRSDVPGVEEVPEDWSRDGQHVLFTDFNLGDLWLLNMADRTTRPLVELPGYATNARIAPEGRWFAYQSSDLSTDDVRRTEIFVQPLPGTVEDRIQVTTAGGMYPAWSSDGTRLYYLSVDDDLTEIEMRFAADGGIQPGRRRVLFRVPPGSRFDVHPDGSRFLVNRPVATEPFRITVLPTVGP